MKRFLPLIILILAPLSLLLAKPAQAQTNYDTYIAQPGDSLWALAEAKVPESENKTMVVNAVKNLEIMFNNLDDTNYYLEIGQSYKLLTQAQISLLISQISPSMPGNAAYLIANPSPVPNWQDLRIAAQPLRSNIIIPPFLGNNPPPLQNPPFAPPNVEPPIKPEDAVGYPQIQGAHTSLIPLADSPFPY